jgi:ribosomal protein S6
MKIIKDPRVRKYELTYLVPAGLTSDEVKKINETIVELVKKAKGKLLNTTDWGKKELAYTIKHEGKRQNEAIYTHLELELDSTQTPKLETDLRIQPQVMRSLLVVASSVEAKPEAKAKVEPKEKVEAKAKVKAEVKAEVKPKKATKDSKKEAPSEASKK